MLIMIMNKYILHAQVMRTGCRSYGLFHFCTILFRFAMFKSNGLHRPRCDAMQHTQHGTANAFCMLWAKMHFERIWLCLWKKKTETKQILLQHLNWFTTEQFISWCNSYFISQDLAAASSNFHKSKPKLDSLLAYKREIFIVWHFFGCIIFNLCRSGSKNDKGNHSKTYAVGRTKIHTVDMAVSQNIQFTTTVRNNLHWLNPVRRHVGMCMACAWHVQDLTSPLAVLATYIRRIDIQYTILIWKCGSKPQQQQQQHISVFDCLTKNPHH